MSTTTIPEVLDDAERRWLELGRKLRRNNPALYQELRARIAADAGQLRELLCELLLEDVDGAKAVRS